MGDVDDTFPNQFVIHIVKTHGPKVVSAYATEFKPIPFVLGYPHVLKSFGGFPDTFDKSALLGFIL
jgi:hypothetical protein